MSLSPRRWSYEAYWMEMHGNTIKYVSLFMELQRFQLFSQHSPLDIVFFLSIQTREVSHLIGGKPKHQMIFQQQFYNFHVILC